MSSLVEQYEGVPNNLRRMAVSPCGQLAFIYDFKADAFILINRTLRTRSMMYLKGVLKSFLVVEEMRIFKGRNRILFLMSDKESSKVYLVIAVPDYTTNMIQSLDIADFDTIQLSRNGMASKQVQLYVIDDVCYVLKQTGRQVDVQTAQLTMVDGEYNEVRKKSFETYHLNKDWNFPFVWRKRLYLMDADTGFTKATSIDLNEPQSKWTKHKCRGDGSNHFPKGTALSTVFTSGTSAYIFITQLLSETKNILWSLDMVNFQWRKSALTFSDSMHQPTRLRAIALSDAGRTFFHGICGRVDCTTQAHLLVFDANANRNARCINVGLTSYATPSGLENHRSRTSSFNNLNPSAPPFEDGLGASCSNSLNVFGSTNSAALPSASNFPQSGGTTMQIQIRAVIEMGYDMQTVNTVVFARDHAPFPSMSEFIEELERVTGRPNPGKCAQLVGILPAARERSASTTEIDLAGKTATASGGAEEPADSVNRCIVCYDNMVSVLILPCKHLVLCNACSSLIHDKCPKCRVNIGGKIDNVFL